MLPADLREDVYGRMIHPKYEARPMQALKSHTIMRKAKLENSLRSDQTKLPEQPRDEPEKGQDGKVAPAMCDFWKRHHYHSGGLQE